MSLLSLSNELILLITRYLKPYDLASILLASKFLSILLLPQLHKIAILDHNGTPALFWAVKKGHVALAKLILEKGSNINEVHVCEKYIETALLRAVKDKNLSMVRLLMGWGADTEILNAHGNTALIESVWNSRRIGICRLLLENGARVNLPENSASVTSSPNSPLDSALGNGYRTPNIKIIKIILQNGARVNDLDINGITPLAKALNATHPLRWPVVEALLKAGADPDHKNMYGETVLHTILGEPYFVKRLIDSGANMDIQNPMGETPLYKAIRQCHYLTVDLLLRNGANWRIPDKEGRTLILSKR